MVLHFISAAVAPVPRGRSLIDLLRETGIFGSLSVLVFIGGIILAIVLLATRSSGVRRAAFIPYAFLPLVCGLVGFGIGYRGIASLQGAAGFDLASFFLGLAEVVSAVILGGMESAILLLIAALLLLTAPRARRTAM